MKKNKTTRHIASLTMALLIIFSTLLLSGCYIVDSGKMRAIEGTYELTTYSTRDNRIEARGMQLFIVIKSDGNGYYAYRDNDTPLHLSEMKCRFTQDTEKSGHYSYVELEFKNSNNWFKLGVNARAKQLGSNIPKYKGNIFEGTLSVDYYETITFTRVDKATDTSYISDTLGELPIMPYGTPAINGTYSTSTVASGESFDLKYYDTPFVYFYLTIDIYTSMAEARYMLKSNEVEETKIFEFSLGEYNEGYHIRLSATESKITISSSSGPSLRIPTEIVESEGTVDAYHLFTFEGAKSDEDIENFISNAIEAYEIFKENQNENDA